MNGPTRVAVLGATGFIGSHIVTYGQAAGADVTAVSLARVQSTPCNSSDAAVADAAAAWCRSHRDAFESLCRSLAPYDAVVNAAGDPRAGNSSTTANLVAANAVLPAVVARAARVAGVRRLVHVSTAAVQGRLDPLDETGQHFPLSPYAATKARGERALLTADRSPGAAPAEVVVYRPTSVQAVRHHATRAFTKLVGQLPRVPVAGSGERPVPVAQLDNVAAGVLFTATMADPPPIVLQPDEDMTVRRLLELFGARGFVSLPRDATRLTLDQLARLARGSAYLTSRLRWFELLIRGQAVEAKALPAAGFTLPVGVDGWHALAAAERSDLRSGAGPGAPNGASRRSRQYGREHHVGHRHDGIVGPATEVAAREGSEAGSSQLLLHVSPAVVAQAVGMGRRGLGMRAGFVDHEVEDQMAAGDQLGRRF